MALSASIFKTNVQLSDMDRQHYSTYSLTLARHPSETDERMMARLIAFMRYADERLVFTKGLSETEEPDLWIKDLTGRTDLWIEVGAPTVKRVITKSRQVRKIVVFGYGRNADLWWKKSKADLEKISNLEVVILPAELTESISRHVERSMEWQCLIQDSQMSLIGKDGNFEVDLQACTRLAME